MTPIEHAVEAALVEMKTKPTVDVPVVVILVGLQYAGKSKLATALSQEGGFLHVWGTKLKAEFRLTNDDLVQVSLQVIAKAASRGVGVVVDAVNANRADRDRLVDASTKNGAIGRVVFLDVPESVRLQQRQASLAEPEREGRRRIALDEMARFKQLFEAPTPDEKPMIVPMDWTIDAVLAELGCTYKKA